MTFKKLIKKAFTNYQVLNVTKITNLLENRF